ncbi:MAG TPA: extracellular solute-binding protein [Verrucomicrobiae bacterium]|jgi:iron(III) transport system substrate-binding protein|nr:extracellular solute-binding protein [Verrucomicrobiae bacterium]
MRRRIFFAAVFSLCFLPLLAGAAEVRDKAESEGKVTLYASMTATDAKALVDGFKQVYPKIDAEFYRTSDSQLMEKILTEGRAGRPLWDVVSETGYFGHLLKKRGMLVAYDSPERKFYRDAYKDPQALWTSIYTTYAVFGYNTKLIPKTSVPKTYDDLLKPEWKGQIGIEGRAFEWFATTMRSMGGEEKGLAFMRRLAQQQLQPRPGRTLVAQLVAAGEHRGSVSVYSQSYEILKQNGAPVDWVPLDPVYASIHPTGINAKAPHPNAARLLMDFILSKKGQEILRAARRIPDRIDTPPDPPRLIEGIRPAVTSAEVYDNFDRYIKLYDETFKFPK